MILLISKHQKQLYLIEKQTIRKPSA